MFLVFPFLAPRQQKPSVESDAWAAGLRGGPEEKDSSDPLVFGKPRRKRNESGLHFAFEGR